MALRWRLFAVGMLALGGCANDDVGISGSASASDSGTDTDTGTATLSGSATMTGAEGTMTGAESSGSGDSGTAMMTDSASTGPDVVCGDDAIGDGEICDGSELGGETCTSQGFAAGTLACLADCSGYDTSGCSSCGNAAIDGDDVCDGDDLGGSDCAAQGFDAGELACAADCSALDTTGCFDFMGACCEADDTPGCDNAACTAAVCAIDDNCCDGPWDNSCAADAFDQPACIDAGGSCPVCGDGGAEGGEACDSTDVLGQDCLSVGFDDGTLGCASDCASLDTSACVDWVGDCCAADGTPGCDDNTCTESVCAAIPSCCDDGWDDVCAAAAFNDPACLNVGGSCPVCGDDVAEGPEACDGADLFGDDCINHGFDGGTLLCEADCSALDLSQCRDVGFADCVNNPPDVCLASEQCITDLAVPPTVGVCTDPDCLVASDCPLAPPGGTAPVLCVDVTGEGINECILFCALGQTCPTGMHCELDLACAWAAN